MDEPRIDKPLHGPERKNLGPLLIVVLVLLAVLAIMAVLIAI